MQNVSKNISQTPETLAFLKLENAEQQIVSTNIHKLAKTLAFLVFEKAQCMQKH